MTVPITIPHGLQRGEDLSVRQGILISDFCGLTEEVESGFESGGSAFPDARIVKVGIPVQRPEEQKGSQ